MFKYALEITLYEPGSGGRLFHQWIVRHTLLMYSRLAPDCSSRLYYLKCNSEALHHLMFIFEECNIHFDMVVRKNRN